MVPLNTTEAMINVFFILMISIWIVHFTAICEGQMIMQFNLISRWPVTWCNCNMVYLFICQRQFLPSSGAHRSFILDLISPQTIERREEETLVSLWGKGPTRGVLSNVMGRKEIQEKWRESERERYRGLRLPLLATIDFSLSFRVHQLYLSIPAPFPPEPIYPSLASTVTRFQGPLTLSPHTVQKQAYLLFYITENIMERTTTTKAVTLLSRKHWHSWSSSAVALCIRNLKRDTNRPRKIKQKREGDSTNVALLILISAIINLKIMKILTLQWCK